MEFQYITDKLKSVTRAIFTFCVVSPIPFIEDSGDVFRWYMRSGAEYIEFDAVFFDAEIIGEDFHSDRHKFLRIPLIIYHFPRVFLSIAEEIGVMPGKLDLRLPQQGFPRLECRRF